MPVISVLLDDVTSHTSKYRSNHQQVAQLLSAELVQRSRYEKAVLRLHCTASSKRNVCAYQDASVRWGHFPLGDVVVLRPNLVEVVHN